MQKYSSITRILLTNDCVPAKAGVEERGGMEMVSPILEKLSFLPMELNIFSRILYSFQDNSIASEIGEFHPQSSSKRFPTETRLNPIFDSIEAASAVSSSQPNSPDFFLATVVGWIDSVSPMESDENILQLHWTSQ